MRNQPTPLISRRCAATLGGLFVLATLGGCASTEPAKPAAVDLPSKGEETRVTAADVPRQAPPVPNHTEVALPNGTEVVANTPAGKMIISAGPGRLRTYSWNGATRWAVLKPRQERWAGSLGLHYEGEPEGWQPHEGMTRVKLEEGQRHFDNVDDAMIWMQIRRLHFVHSNDGLVVGWRRQPSEKQLQVEVWQFYIDGEKPSFMPGAKDYLIDVRQAPVRAADSRR